MTRSFTIAASLLTAAIFVGLSACSPAPDSTANSAVNSAVKSTANSIAKSPEQNSSSNYLNRNIQDEIFYFVMPDRFHNAITENDNGDPNRPISYGGLDQSSKWAFHGGDIAGVEAKLDYLENMGVSAIWMTPILRNRAIQPDGFGHHGYWVVDFTEIDPHFGSNDDLKSLIEAAHKRDIKIFFDIITNHTADVIKYKECHDETGKFLNKDQKGCPFISTEELAQGKQYTPFVLKSEKDAKVPAWLNDPKYYNNQGDSFWQGESAIKGDFVGLDDIDTDHPEVISGLTEVFKNLVTEFKPDGFRIDTVKHVDLVFWQSFGPSIMQHAQNQGIPEFFIFGEVFDGNPAGLSKFTNAGKLPSVLDFSFAFNTRDVIFRNKSVKQFTTLFDNDDYYRDADTTPNDLINFIGNHDVGRVGHFIQNDQPNLSAEEQLQRSKLAHAFMYLSRGVPVVYYGDEQGFTGDGGDVDARENMDPSKVAVYNDNLLIGTHKTTAENNFDSTHPLYQYFTELATLRKSHEQLRRSDQFNRLSDEAKRVYAFSRISSKHMQDYLVVFNFSTTKQTVSMNRNTLNYDVVSGEGTVTENGDQIRFDLPPLTYTLAVSKGTFSPSNILDIHLQARYEDNDRIFLPVDVHFENTAQFNIAKVDFYAIDENGKESLIAFDTTAPYRAVLMPAQLNGVKQIKIVASNNAEQTVSKRFEL